jgi:hypothetical protein
VSIVTRRGGIIGKIFASTILGALACLSFLQCVRPPVAIASSSPKAPEFAYFFTVDGSFLKLQANDGRVAADWNLSQIDGSSAALPPCQKVKAYADPGCDVLFDRMQAGEGKLYGVFPTKANPDEEGNRTYQVLVFQIPEMKIIGTIPIPQAQPQWPSFLLTPDGQRFFLNYRDRAAEKSATEPTVVSVVDVYSSSTLTKLSSMREEVATKVRRVPGGTLVQGFNLNVALLYNSYFSSDGSTIFNGLRTAKISGSSMEAHNVNPLERLSAQQQEQLKPFQTIEAGSQKPYFNYGVADSAAGKTLIEVANASRTEAAYWTVDLPTSQLSPVFLAPLGVVRLTPDATQVLIQQSQVHNDGGGNVGETLLGAKFWLYDVASGNKIGEFSDADVAGPFSSNRLLCFSSDGKQFFYAVNNSIYVVSLPSGATVRAIETGLPDLSKAISVLADR